MKGGAGGGGMRSKSGGGGDGGEEGSDGDGGGPKSMDIVPFARRGASPSTALAAPTPPLLLADPTNLQ